MKISASINRVQIITSFLFTTILALTLAVYWPGISGDFIFDDLANLNSINNYKDFSTWENFLLFMLEGRSGPTGRPVSLASFYLNDIAWPSTPEGFIITNILIHLLNGVLVFLLITKLLASLRLKNSQANIIALITTATWLLHPFNSTTVLYIIQRMTELSSLFILIGLVLYIYGRDQLKKGWLGMITLYIGVGLSLVLSILSKENGVLLVSYILVIEIFLFRSKGIKSPLYFNYWFIPSIIIPFLLVICYISYKAINIESFLSRDFTLNERLLTEARILFDYIYNIILPKVSGTGLYHDDYIISKGLLTPWTTLPAILGVIFLLISSIYLRTKVPFISFAIMWFFSGHLLESTVIPLELYFEHRNYLPMLGILIAFSYYIYKLSYNNYLIFILTLLLIIFSFSFLSYEKSSLWGKPSDLLASWSNDHPGSPRAQAANLHTNQHPTNKKNKLNKLTANNTLWILFQACESKEINKHHMSSAIEVIKKTTIKNDSGNGLDQFFYTWLDKKCTHITSKQMELFLLQMISLGNRDNNSMFIYTCHEALSELYKSEGNLSKTIAQLEMSYKTLPQMTTLLKQSYNLATAGLYNEALNKLEDTELLTNTFRKRLIFRLTRKRIDFLKNEILTIMATKQKINI